MKTRPIPAIVMLLAGLLTCIYGIANHTEIIHFIWTLLLVMIIFYVLGSVVKVIIDYNFKQMDRRAEDDAEETNAKKEAVADTVEKSDGENE